MRSDFQKEDDAQVTGGLSGNDVGVISAVVVLGIVWAIGALLFRWHFDLKRACITALLLVGLWWWGNASERAEDRERRLKRIERKLDKALEHLRDRM